MKYVKKVAHVYFQNSAQGEVWASLLIIHALTLVALPPPPHGKKKKKNCYVFFS